MNVVHIIVAGQAFCGQKGPPNLWPTNHTWVPPTRAIDANCARCKEMYAFSEKEKKGDQIQA